MRHRLNIFVLALAAAAGTLGLAVGPATSRMPVCAGSIVGLCYVCARLSPLLFRRTTATTERGNHPLSDAAGGETFSRSAPVAAGETDSHAAAVRMFETDRYAFLTRHQLFGNLSPELRAESLAVLRRCMAPVPAGTARVGPVARVPDDDDARRIAGREVTVEAFYLDRYCVTNRQYAAFVAGGGYDEAGLWDPDIWPRVGDFVDFSGHPGPRHWRDGRPPAGREDHPVVGVCWFEARAFARWVGKRLPTDSEWVKAASWPVPVGNGLAGQRKYPWGNSMDRRRANLWGSGPGGTLPVTALPEGAGVGGLFQLCGNVWEWTADEFAAWCPRSERIQSPFPLKAIRGGAFDTYFENHASNEFQSGENPLSRQANIGFRCALSQCDVADDRPANDQAGQEAARPPAMPAALPVTGPAVSGLPAKREAVLAVAAPGEALA